MKSYKYKLLILTISIIITLIPFPSFAQDTISFSSTNITIKINQNYIESDQLTITLNGAPNLPDGYNYRINFDGSTNFYDFTDNSTSNPLGYNLMKNGKIMELLLITPTNNITLGNKEIQNGIWNHVGHIYVNWTFGTNPPKDGRGFGQGVVADSKILDLLIGTTIGSESELLLLAEKSYNLLFGNSVDFSGDDVVEHISDGYGLFNYTIGMRDHIRNAGVADSNQSSEIALSSINIIEDFSNVIDEGTSIEAYSILNKSKTIFGDVFKSIMNIKENITTDNFNQMHLDLENHIFNLTDFLVEKYDEFRHVLFDYTFTIDQLEITLSDNTGQTNSQDNSSTDDSPLNFTLILVVVLIITSILNKIASRKTKL